MSRAVGADIKLTHDAAEGAIVVFQGSMAELARNSLGVADQKFAQIVKSWASNDGSWSGSGDGSAEDDSSRPSPPATARGTWGDTERIG